jgi:hypothetical protein
MPSNEHDDDDPALEQFLADCRRCMAACPTLWGEVSEAPPMDRVELTTDAMVVEAHANREGQTYPTAEQAIANLPGAPGAVRPPARCPPDGYGCRPPPGVRHRGGRERPGPAFRERGAPPLTTETKKAIPALWEQAQARLRGAVEEVECLPVTTCNRKPANLQSAHFSTGIICN